MAEDPEAARLVSLLTAARLTVATAESLTGGLLAGAVTAVPGASQVFRGGVVAYATDLKHDQLGVDADLLAGVGAVHPRVAAAMADGARRRLGADLGLATTGVAGPDPQDGHPPGVVWVGLADARGSWAVDATTDGAAGRAGVRAATVRAALAAAVRLLTGEDPPAAHR
ncbi:CinA family protein [Angustibacter luteus]|uniref:CinA family protein n=1 Tax=Angustibacter luteus TaxID=658456 RepID=UPI0031ECF939